MEVVEDNKKENKKGKSENFFYFIFIKNFPLKVLSIIMGCLYWCVRIGLNGEFTTDWSALWELVKGNILAQFSDTFSIVMSVIDILLIVHLFLLVEVALKRVNISPVLKYVFFALFFSAIFGSAMFKLPVMDEYCDFIIILIFVFFIVLYNPEVKRFIQQSSKRTVYDSYSRDYDCSEDELRRSCEAIVKAVLNMSKNNVGALIVIANQAMPEHIIESGIALNSELSQPLIECIFNTKAYLHDGAVFVRANKIISAGCFLPLTQRDLPKELGTRHRAALGLGEQYDVLIIVCSEETGVISMVEHGQIERYCDAETLTNRIEMVYGIKENRKKRKKV